MQLSDRIHHPPFLLCLVCCNNPSPPNAVVNTHVHARTHISHLTQVNKLLLTSEITILVQGYSFSQHFFFSLLQTFPSGSLLSATSLSLQTAFFHCQLCLSLILSLIFKCHSSANSIPDCFDRLEPDWSRRDLISPWSGVLAEGSALKPLDAEP